jgi:predicted DNA-binding antitoxin AbrB/MazE fold protein
MTIRATYENGVLRPLEALHLEEGQTVFLRLEEDSISTSGDELTFEQARERSLARMRKGMRLGGRPLTREEIYDRRLYGVRFSDGRRAW